MRVAAGGRNIFSNIANQRYFKESSGHVHFSALRHDCVFTSQCAIGISANISCTTTNRRHRRRQRQEDRDPSVEDRTEKSREIFMVHESKVVVVVSISALSLQLPSTPPWRVYSETLN